MTIVSRFQVVVNEMDINYEPAEKMGITGKNSYSQVTVQSDPSMACCLSIEGDALGRLVVWVFRMGYGGLKLGTENSNATDRSLQGRTRAESLQGREKGGTIATRKKKAWEEEEHLRTLRDVRDLLARGPPVVHAAAAAATAAAAASEEGENMEEEWQEREGGLRQRETLQQFSNWICEERASKTLGGGRGERCKDFGTFVGGSFRGSNGSEMCKKIYDRERERCKVTNGTTLIDITPLPRRNATNRPTVRRDQRTI